jgi:arylsulfatase A-like enzyme
MRDDFGYSDIGSFEGEISTPNLDILARDDKMLTNYHTMPTRSPHFSRSTNYFCTKRIKKSSGIEFDYFLD